MGCLAVLRSSRKDRFGFVARGFGGGFGGVKEGFEFVEVFWGGGLESRAAALGA